MKLNFLNQLSTRFNRKNTHSKVFSIWFMVISLIVANGVQAQIELDVSGGEVRGIPTAIVPFKFVDDGSLQTDVASIVSKDLTATGKFD